NLDLSKYKIHGEWVTIHHKNPIRHVSIDNYQFFEMKTQMKNINFIFDIEIYNKYSHYTWTALKRNDNYYLQVSIKDDLNKTKQISYFKLLLKENPDIKFGTQNLKRKS
ncbi:308_t:CDS:1, partial [Cetraspora pellucida]